jgi:hypothetical protein
VPQMADKVFDFVTKAMVFGALAYSAFLLLRWVYLHT